MSCEPLAGMIVEGGGQTAGGAVGVGGVCKCLLWGCIQLMGLKITAR